MSSDDAHPSPPRPVQRHLLRQAIWLAVLIAGVIVWLISFGGGGGAARAWRGLLISFIFFTPLSAGLVVWSAAVLLSNGRWIGRLERAALSGFSFAVPSLVVLALLWMGSGTWLPWSGKELSQGVWLNRHFVFARDLGALIVLWALAAWYVRRRTSGDGRVAGGWLIVTYCLVMSLLGFDLVMALDPKWYSTLWGGYFFISGLYAAVTVWTLLAIWSPGGTRDRMHDLAKLIVAFSILTAYLAYAHVLVQWYGNIPHETRFLVPRMNFEPWRSVSVAIVAAAYLGPLVLLLTIRAKRTRWFLAAVALLVLSAMWLERCWLVTPTVQWTAPPAMQPDQLRLAIGLAELGPLAALGGVLALGIEVFTALVPPRIGQGAQDL
ncbi:MAG: hypothetical protein ABFD92_00515 [Planctomycetaceae bacterium]|nr:hypothetical protein [Planctomycetaceae bacterium]